MKPRSASPRSLGRPRRTDPLRHVSLRIPLSVWRRYETASRARGETTHALLQRSVIAGAPNENE